MKKNIIVTGTSRCIGYQMVPILADAGHNVLALSRDNVPISGLEITNCYCFPCDITDADDIKKVSEFRHILKPILECIPKILLIW